MAVPADPPASRNNQSAELIDLTQPAALPARTRAPDMTFPRPTCREVERRPVLKAEIFDPKTNTWSPTAPMQSLRQYHSVAVLVPDGRVLFADGVDPSPSAARRDQRTMKILSPSYPRPRFPAEPDRYLIKLSSSSGRESYDR